MTDLEKLFILTLTFATVPISPQGQRPAEVHGYVVGVDGEDKERQIAERGSIRQVTTWCQGI